jgi:two-component system sensor histidine kinase FlrB
VSFLIETGGWPLAMMLAFALLRQSFRASRRRTAINRALHEVRRPLQAFALAGPDLKSTRSGAGSLGLAMAALAQLDAEVNRGRAPDDPVHAPCAELLEDAIARWQTQAAIAGKAIEIRDSTAANIAVAGSAAVAQAVDNLIVNAIEHGGPEIVVEASTSGTWVRFRVADNGDGSVRPKRFRLTRLSGRRRRGHGLDVVRRIASGQGGRFMLQRSQEGTVAHLELPIVGDGGACAA